MKFNLVLFNEFFFPFVLWQILYAVRTIVDIDLNWRGENIQQAQTLYNKYVWLGDPDFVEKDLVRFFSFPGIATSYVIGQLNIVRIRDLVKTELGQDFSLKDFHYELLRQGEYPLPYLEENMKAYITCRKNSSQVGCEEFF